MISALGFDERMASFATLMDDSESPLVSSVTMTILSEADIRSPLLSRKTLSDKVFKHSVTEPPPLMNSIAEMASLVSALVEKVFKSHSILAVSPY